MSKHRTLAEAVGLQSLGYPLSDWVADQRKSDHSWQTIAATLSEQTDGVISVSWETLRTWYA